jgi:hypothetical protein
VVEYQPVDSRHIGDTLMSRSMGDTWWAVTIGHGQEGDADEGAGCGGRGGRW